MSHNSINPVIPKTCVFLAPNPLLTSSYAKGTGNNITL